MQHFLSLVQKKEISRDLSWNLDLAEDKTEKYFLIKSLSHCPSY